MATPTTTSARKPHNKNNLSPISTPIFNSLRKTNWKNRSNSTRTPFRFAGKNPPPPSLAVPHTPLFDFTTKKVTLLDWWLIKVLVQGSNHFKFGVGGNAFDGQASTYFSSGEIVKRHDEMTLETVDGITITLASLLNRSSTLENGFPSQVCDHFFLGFPFDWEEFGAQYFGGCLSKAARMSSDDIDEPKCLLSSLDDIPVTRLFDHMMVSSGDYNECPLTRSVFDHILSEYGSASAKLCGEDTDQIRAEDNGVPLHVSEKNNKQLVARRCSLDKALKDQLGGKDDNVILDDMPLSGQDLNFSSTTLDKSSKLRRNLNRSSGVLTRSKSRSKKLSTDPEDIKVVVFSSTAEESARYRVQTKKITDPCPTLESEKSEKKLSSRHVTNKFSEVNNQLLDRPGVRRSSRKRNVVEYGGL